MWQSGGLLFAKGGEYYILVRDRYQSLIFFEVAVKVIVAALTAFLTAITTTSCMGFGPF